MKRLAPVLLIAASVLASGCGTSAQAKRRHFVERASGVCSHFSALQNQVQFPATNPTDPKATHTARAEWGVALKRVVYLGTQEVAALRKLDAPDALAGRFDALLMRMDSAYAHLLAAAEAAKRNHVAALRDAARAGRAELARAATAARRAGLPACR